MKILQLTTHLRMGGVSIYVTTLARAMKKLGHEVFIASSGGDLSPTVERSGIPHIQVDIDTRSELHPKLIAGVYQLFWLIREKDIQVIHTHTRVTQVMGEILSFLTGAAHVSTCHGFFKLKFGRRLFGCWGKRVIAISDAVREHLVNDFKLKKSRTELIYNGIDLDGFNTRYTDEERGLIKKELGLKQEGPIVGIIARLSSVKGHRYLIQAMKKILDKTSDAQLLIVGDGDEESALKDLCRDLKISDSVVFIKSVVDTSRVLAVMDVFVLPSIVEGLGLALLEALCSGVSVVASDVGGVYSIVRDNETGLLVPPRDSNVLAQSIVKLLEDKGLSRRLAENGRKVVRKKFSLEEMANKVEGTYKSVLS